MERVDKKVSLYRISMERVDRKDLDIANRWEGSIENVFLYRKSMERVDRKGFDIVNRWKESIERVRLYCISMERIDRKGFALSYIDGKGRYEGFRFIVYRWKGPIERVPLYRMLMQRVDRKGARTFLSLSLSPSPIFRKKTVHARQQSHELKTFHTRDLRSIQRRIAASSGSSFPPDITAVPIVPIARVVVRPPCNTKKKLNLTPPQNLSLISPP